MLGPRFQAVGKLGPKGRVDPGVAFVTVYLMFYQYFVLTKLFGAEQIYGRRTEAQVIRELIELFQDGLGRRRSKR